MVLHFENCQQSYLLLFANKQKKRYMAGSMQFLLLLKLLASHHFLLAICELHATPLILHRRRENLNKYKNNEGDTSNSFYHLQSLFSSRPMKPYNFLADLIWCDSPLYKCLLLADTDFKTSSICYLLWLILIFVSDRMMSLSDSRRFLTRPCNIRKTTSISRN
jgi:hypothetical protein